LLILYGTAKRFMPTLNPSPGSRPLVPFHPSAPTLSPHTASASGVLPPPRLHHRHHINIERQQILRRYSSSCRAVRPPPLARHRRVRGATLTRLPDSIRWTTSCGKPPTIHVRPCCLAALAIPPLCANTFSPYRMHPRILSPPHLHHDSAQTNPPPPHACKRMPEIPLLLRRRPILTLVSLYTTDSSLCFFSITL
jgi:hypothetical protein